MKRPIRVLQWLTLLIETALLVRETVSRRTRLRPKPPGASDWLRLSVDIRPGSEFDPSRLDPMEVASALAPLFGPWTSHFDNVSLQPVTEPS